ncbi:PREDICTED: uncharacterized protein LOC105556667 [Vollenhovia emeryi]|uniref:uncharacterized protein LOC105556667 n=1 Tax=Vollenhovia emeryi TaxID=411798 RepID=UPI0005F48D20|nr:PREDICTED: uncharacterized protein LOC105556667 [Vollenhovia emeryi]
MYIMEQLWSIIEFEDGMEMIPTSWITENKSAARWPPFTSQLKFNRAVQKCISYESNWPLHKIKKILGSSSSYEKGFLKLKKAEMASDINSENDDYENFKKSRKDRAKKVISSSEDSDSSKENTQLPCYPKIPQTKGNAFNTKVKTFDKSKTQFTEEVVTTCEENKKKSGNTNVREIKTNNDNDVIYATCSKDMNYHDKSSVGPYTSNIGSSRSDFERYVIRKLTDVGFQLSSLQEQGKVLNTRIDIILQNLQTSVSHEIEDKTTEEEIMNTFPFETVRYKIGYM